MTNYKDVIKNLDKSKELSSEIKELLDTLYLLAEQKADIFLMEIMDSINKEDDRKLPVTVLIDEEKAITSFVENNAKELETIIDKLFSLFVKHNKETVAEKIKDSLVAALNIFFGSSVANSDSMEKYYIILDGYSAIRIDIKSWYHSVECTSLRTYCERITCVAATKSIVDLSKIDISTFMYFYQTQLISSGIKGEDLEQEMENVRKIYDKFHQSMNG